MDKYVKLAHGKRYADRGFSIKTGEVKKCPDVVIDNSGGHLQVVSRPRQLRSIVRPHARPYRKKAETVSLKSESKDEKVDVDNSG